MFKEEGREVPSVMRDRHWEELVKLTTRSARLKYYKYVVSCKVGCSQETRQLTVRDPLSQVCLQNRDEAEGGEAEAGGEGSDLQSDEGGAGPVAESVGHCRPPPLRPRCQQHHVAGRRHQNHQRGKPTRRDPSKPNKSPEKEGEGKEKPPSSRTGVDGKEEKWGTVVRVNGD